MSKGTLARLVFFAVVSVATGFAGVPDNWNGGYGDWNSSSYWSAGVPGINSDVTINSGANDYVTLDSYTVTHINTLSLGGSASGYSELYSYGNLTITDTLTVAQNGIVCGCTFLGTITAGSLFNAGTIVGEGGGNLQILGDANNSGFIQMGPEQGGPHIVDIAGMLTNSGQVELDAKDTMATFGGLTNSGTVEVASHGTVQINGGVSNSGILETSAGSGLGVPLGFNTITINGMLTNNMTGQITLDGPDDVLDAFGGISNNGHINLNGSTVQTALLNNLALVNIDSSSKFVVGSGNPGGTGYIQLSNGTLGEMISATTFGTINVNGSALLAGTLNILLQGGFNPSVGSKYKFLFANPGGISGTFAIIENDIFNNDTEKWQLTYDNVDGYLELTAEPNSIPEPSTTMDLLGSGAFAAVALIFNGRLRQKLLGRTAR